MELGAFSPYFLCYTFYIFILKCFDNHIIDTKVLMSFYVCLRHIASYLVNECALFEQLNGELNTFWYYCPSNSSVKYFELEGKTLET